MLDHNKMLIRKEASLSREVNMYYEFSVKSRWGFNRGYLKLMSSIFYQILIFSPNVSPLKTMKIFFYFI